MRALKVLIVLTIAGCGGAQAGAPATSPARAAAAPTQEPATQGGADKEQPHAPILPPVYAGVTEGEGLDTRLAEVRSALEVLRDKGMGEAREAAGGALLSLAGALAAMHEEPRSVGRALHEMHFQAERLRRADSFADGARWAKRGLEAALEALSPLVAERDEERLSPWLASAQSAIKAIDTDPAITFQRAAVQDAFRTVFDAVSLVAQSDALCATP